MNSTALKTPGICVSETGPTGLGIASHERLATPRRDERKSGRCKVPPARQACAVKVEGNVLTASLENDSKDGFAVLIDRLDLLKVGKKVELRTEMGWFVVRIVYINQVARPKDAAPECDSWFRLGVKIKQRLQQQRPLP